MIQRILFTVVVLCTTIYAQQTLDKIVAIVDDDVILQSEVTQAAYYMALQLGIDPSSSSSEFEELQKNSLESLINQKLLLIQADKDTITADERQVDAYLQQQIQTIVQQLGGEDKVEEHFGTTMSRVRRNYREEIEKNFRIRAVQDQKMADIVVTRREVEQYFNTHQDSLQPIKETVDISHILVSPQAGEEAERAALERIDELRERIIQGEEFAELAKQYSDDPGSASRGGDLGFMSRGEFVREFEEAAFNLETGEISEPVKTEYGYHIIRMEEKRGEKIHTHHILIALKPSREDEIAAAEKIKEIHRQLREGASFIEMVEQYSTDESSRDLGGHLGKFEIDQLRQTAKEFIFVLQDVEVGGISDPVKTQFGFHILKLNAKEEPRPLTLEKDWDRIEARALEFKKQGMFQSWLEEIKQDVYVEIKAS